MSACAAGIPKTTHSSPPVPERIPLPEALPLMGIVLCCVWAAYTTIELPELAASTVMYPEFFFFQVSSFICHIHDYTESV